MNIMYNAYLLHLLPRSTFAFAPILANHLSHKRQAGRMPRTFNVRHKTVYS